MGETIGDAADIAAALSPGAQEALMRGGGATPAQAWELMGLRLLEDDGQLGWRPPHTMTKLGERVRSALAAPRRGPEMTNAGM